MSRWIEKCATLAANALEVGDDAVFWRKVDATVWINPHHYPTDADKAAPQLIHNRIMAFAGPTDMSNIESMAASLHEAARQVNKNKDSALGNVKNPGMNGWSGEAADDFNIYIGKMMSAVQNHSEVLRSMAVVTDAYAALVQAMEADLESVVARGMSAIEEEALNPAKIGEGIVGSIGKVVSVAKGEVLEGVLTALEAGAGNEVQGLSADDDMAVLHAFAAELKLLRRSVEHEAERIGRAYDAINMRIVAELPSMNPDPPDIVMEKAFDPDRFGIPSSGHFAEIKDKVSRDELVKKPEKKGPDADRHMPPGATW